MPNLLKNTLNISLVYIYYTLQKSKVIFPMDMNTIFINPKICCNV